MKKTKNIFFSFLVGFANALFGAGGGMIAVPLLRAMGEEEKSCHTGAIAVILPVTLISAGLYLYKGYVTFKDAFVFMPSGVVGAFIATVIVSKISPMLLKTVFGIFAVIAGVRLLLK